MKNAKIYALLLGLTFASNLAASSQHELLEDGKQPSVLPLTTTKNITLNAPMDQVMVDLYTQTGKRSGIRIPLAISVALTKHLTTLNVRIEERSNRREPGRGADNLDWLNCIIREDVLLYENLSVVQGV